MRMEFSNATIKVEPELDINDNCSETEQLTPISLEEISTDCNNYISSNIRNDVGNITDSTIDFIFAKNIKSEPELIIEDVSTIDDTIDTDKNSTSESRCKICSKKISKSYMTRHIRSQHRNKENVNNRRKLLVHKLEPEIKHQFLCDICSKSYNSYANLKKHITLQHCIDNKWACKICDKKLAAKYCLKLHMDIHSDIKRFYCDICQTSYRQQVNYAAHMNLHTAEKQYKCETCGNVYLSLSYFKKHLNIHSRQKTHTCHLCGKVFVHISHHKRHLNIHSRGKTFTCEPCGKSFLRLYSLKEHILAVHCKL